MEKPPGLTEMNEKRNKKKIRPEPFGSGRTELSVVPPEFPRKRDALAR
jgi:hypothetical protein